MGHSNDGKVFFIDTTLDLDFFGVVYICTNCLLEISTSLGYLPPEKWTDLKELNDRLLDENARLKGENDGLRSAVNLLTGHRCFDAAVLGADILKAEGFTTDEGLISGALEGVESSKSEPDPPISEPGLSDVRGTAKPKSSSTKSKSSNDPLAEYDV